MTSRTVPPAEGPSASSSSSPDDSSVPAADGDTQHLARSLSHGQMAMIAMGSALGTGLFLGSGQAIGLAGPAVIISFAIGAVIAATIALSMGEMASRYPVRGGFGTLAARFLSPFWGYLTRWLYWFVTVAVTGTELVACATYLGYWFPQVPMWAGVLLFAAIILGINLISVGSFGVVEFFLSSIKVIAVLVFILVGAFLVAFGMPDAPAPGLENMTAHGGFLPGGLAGIWLAMSVVMFSFGGIELLSITAAEAKNPAVAIRSAARTTIIRLAFFYVAALAIIVALVPWMEVSSGDGSVQASPFVLVFDSIGIPGAAALTNAIVLIAALSAANANLYAGSRIIHALSADGMAPRALSTLSRHHVPVRGIAVSSLGIVGAAALTFSGASDPFLMMIGLVMFSVLLVWALILSTYLAYAPTRDGQETFRLPGGRASAVLGLIGLVFVSSTVVAVPQLQIASMVGVPAVLLAAVLYVVVVRRRADGGAAGRAFDEAETERRHVG